MKIEKNEPRTGENDGKLPLSDGNYKLLLIGAAIILLGFILMSGGEPATAESFNDNIFSWRRITLAPIVVVVGFAFEIYAILKKYPKE
ncbi:MAG: DUF3098 domain-containing protein [Rikenellaceae bacterium]